MQGKKLRCTRCGCRRSGWRWCCGCFSGGGSGGVSRRGWVSRPERTKSFQSERGTCPLLATVTVANGKTHFAANRRIYRPCEIQPEFYRNLFCRFRADNSFGQSGCGANNPPSRLLPCHLLSKGGQRSLKKRCKLLCQKLLSKGAVERSETED